MRTILGSKSYCTSQKTTGFLLLFEKKLYLFTNRLNISTYYYKKLVVTIYYSRTNNNFEIIRKVKNANF